MESDSLKSELTVNLNVQATAIVNYKRKTSLRGDESKTGSMGRYRLTLEGDHIQNALIIHN